MNKSFPFVDAIYRQETIPAFAKNEYIEALPLLDDLTLMRKLARKPNFDPSERQLSATERIRLMHALHQIVVPFSRNVDLARAILKLMMEGYAPRRPFSESDNEILQSCYAAQQMGVLQAVDDAIIDAQNSMALIGASGCGKSFALRRIAQLLPPVIYHEKLGKWQLPFLFIELPYDGRSIQTLASALFAEMDRLLPDGNLRQLYARGNAEQRLIKALACAKEYGVGFIIVDEAQNGAPKADDGSGKKPRKKAGRNVDDRDESRLTKLLITASNTTNIPLLFAGTLELEPTVQARFSFSRRMAGRGSGQWLPFERNPGSSGDFEMLLRVLFKYQWIRNPIEYSEEWADIFFSATQGIPDMMVKLWEACQVKAITSKQETITSELVEKVLADEFKTVSVGLRALRENISSLLSAIPDLPNAAGEDGTASDVLGHCENPPPPRGVVRPLHGKSPRSVRRQPPSPTPLPPDGTDPSGTIAPMKEVTWDEEFPA